MFPAEFDYFCPETLDEVFELLSRHGEDAKILAGGQSLIPMMKLRIAAPKYVIDINHIEALGGLSVVGGGITIGALCRHAEIAASPLIKERLPLMIDAAELTADVQVRNRGTVGGSLAHADPAGDWPAALLALDAEVTIAGPGGSREVSLDEFIVDAYSTLLGPDELVTSVRVPFPSPPCGGAYVKFEKRAGDFAVASVALQLELEDDGTCRRAAVSLGALGPRPVRARAAEEILAGKPLSERVLDQAEQLVYTAAQPFADTRGSVEYKRHLARVLFRRAVAVATDRAHGKVVGVLHM